MAAPLVLALALLAPQTRAFEHNPVTHPVAEVFEFNAFDEGADHLVGPYFESLNCVEVSPGEMCERVATVSPDAEGNVFVEIPDIDDPEDAAALEDAYAEVSAYFHADRFYAHLQEFDVPPPLCFDEGLPLTLVVNVRAPADADGVPGWFGGAFYTGDCERGIVLGQAEGADLAYDGDLVYHEVAHAAIDALSGEGVFLAGTRALPLAVSTDPAALNEGFADFLSAAFTGDPVLGEYIEAYAGLGRRLDHDLGCPQTLVGEQHLDGRAWGAALYALWERYGDRFHAAVLDTIAALPSDAAFADAAAMLETAVLDRLDAEAAADVNATMTARGLAACERVLAPEAVEELHLVPDPGFSPFRPAPLQLELPTVDERSRVTLRYGGTQFGDDWTIEAVVGRGEPVAFAYDAGSSSSAVSMSSEEFLDGSMGTIELVVEPDEAVFLSMFNAGSALVVLRDFEVDVEPMPADEGETDGDTDTGSADSASGDGCSCTTGSPGSIALTLCFLVLGRRRRTVGL
jgi:uncharacterized protein (TIGR03382 family)